MKTKRQNNKKGNSFLHRETLIHLNSGLTKQNPQKTKMDEFIVFKISFAVLFCFLGLWK